MADVSVDAGVATATATANTVAPNVAPTAENVAATATASSTSSITTTTAGTALVAATVPQTYPTVGHPIDEPQTESEEVLPAVTGDFTSADPPHCLLWHPDYEGWAVEQMQARHNGALWRFGEYSMFILLWRIDDFNAGRVRRCPECVTSMDDIAEVYEQSFKTRCPTCYGTTFEGGYKAKIIRPAIWDFSETTNKVDSQGEVKRANTSVQTTSDFAMRTGDYILRADATRWRVQSLSTNHLRTGFGFPDRADTIVGFNYGNVILQDESSNAYAIQLPAELPHILNVTAPRVMQEFARFEEIRGPLLDGGNQPSINTSGYLNPPPVVPGESYAHLHGAVFERPDWNLD